MANGRFWKKAANVIMIILRFNWFLILFTFVILPRLIVLPIRRAIAKNRTQRRLIKNGMPKEDAKIFAIKFRTMIYNYSSVRGLMKMAKIRTKGKDQDEENLEVIESKKNLTEIKFNQLFTI